jgi:hypothetical protein
MDNFLDLGNLYEQIRSVIANKPYREMEIPSNFKSQLTVIGDRRIVYHKYTAIAYKNNADSIIIPNYWFYLATDINPYNIEIHRYYDQVVSLNLFTSERLNELKNKNLSEEEKRKVESSFESRLDADRICRFLTDYKWWHGGKELGRVQKDYYVSAVLSLSGLVNDSSTFLSSICEVIREKPQLSELLVEFCSKDDNKQLPSHMIPPCYIPFITAIKSKPFLLLAGISGTGKSRIVRELARACWAEGSEEYEAQKPKNFEMVQVKPNWHDSSELIGYVSRIGVDKEGNPRPVFVAGDFLKFVARAWEEPDVPYFLCLDEMNLAPVEQYFAEYLSVIESRKADENGNVSTDPILKKSKEDWYRVLTRELTDDDEIRKRFLEDGICIPQNLIVIGTVNMDETTFSFSRKVLDRAMTIEMNEVDLADNLDSRHERIGKLGAAELIGTAVEGVYIYSSYKEGCDTAIEYLQKVNYKLEGTPFKIAYRTRNEVLLYVVNNLPYNSDEDSDDLKQEYVIARALDEITNMKILSRIEGDETRVSKTFLDDLGKAIKEGLEEIFDGPFDKVESDDAFKSVSLAKLEEMKKRLDSGYTSFWS